MINREITYERDINKSYMKIPAISEENLDEKIMLSRSFPGLLPVEKCYVNQKGQYWYNISGKQTLDVYCRVNTIERSFFEGIILRICDQVETLEWNLLDTNCLVVDPELIFLSSGGEEISFVSYPQTGSNFFDELQMLIEYLLTKLDHADKDAVRAAYQIYEMSLIEGCSITDLKEAVIKGRMEESKVECEVQLNKVAETSNYIVEPVEESLNKVSVVEEKLKKLFEKAKEILKSSPEELLRKKEKEDDIPMVVYPEDEVEESQAQIHPTVCIATVKGEAQGVLLYEGFGDYPDFELEKSTCSVGKSHKVNLQINRETISQFHARIDYIQGDYYIEDMNSTNGTFVNDEMLNFREKRLLKTGDLIRFADVKYRFL